MYVQVKPRWRRTEDGWCMYRLIRTRANDVYVLKLVYASDGAPRPWEADQVYVTHALWHGLTEEPPLWYLLGAG